MLKVNIEVDNLKGLEKYIKFIEQLKFNEEFQKEIQKKCLDTVKKVARERFAMFTNTNVDMQQQYIENNKIRNASEKGFEIYNDLTIDKPTTDISKGYKFSIALAFEYGTGIVGIGSAQNSGNYQYNMNEHKVIANNQLLDGWWISKEKNGNNPTFGESKSGKAVVTQGYQGMEIYRFSAEEIKSQYPKWVKDYIYRKGV